MTTHKATPRRASAKKPSVAAREAEAREGVVTIEVCGMKLDVPIGNNVPLDVYLIYMGDEETLRELNIRPQDADVAATRLLLGPKQWAEFRTKGPTLDDYLEISRQLNELAGN